MSTTTFAITACCGWATQDGLSRLAMIKPVRTDLEARVLSTNIELEEGTCSVDLLQSAAGFFGLPLAQARATIKEVGAVTRTWRDIAKEAGARTAGINRMASAFEHDLDRALAL